MTRPPRTALRLAAVLSAGAIATAACGASDQVRLQVASRTAQGGVAAGGAMQGGLNSAGVAPGGGTGVDFTSDGTTSGDASADVASKGDSPGTTGDVTGATGASGSGSGSASTVAAPPRTPNGGNGGSTDVGVTATEIKIGGSFFNGGFLDKYSRSSQEAAAAYFNLINDNGGVFGRKIKYVTCDTQGTADGTQQCARRLVEQDKVFIIGPTLDFNMDTVTGYVGSKKVPWVGTSGLYDAEFQSPWVFPTQLRGGAVGNLMTTFAAKELKKKRIAISQLRNGAGPACTKQVRDVSAKLGLTVTYVAENNDTESDLTDRVIATRNTNPEVVVFCNDPVNNIKFQQAAARQGWKPIFIQGFGTADDVPQAIGSSAEGMYGFTPYEHYDVNTKAMNEYRKVTSFYYPNTFPFSFGVASWSGAQAVVQALTKAGPDLTRTSFLNALKNMKKFDIGLGLSFDFSNPSGVCPPVGHFTQVKRVDGQLKYVPIGERYAGTGGC
jgi:branched-chain amino acid transport system substrate-binding protein